MSDNEQNEPTAVEDAEWQEEVREREESNQIWQCFMEYDIEQQGVIRTNELK